MRKRSAAVTLASVFIAAAGCTSSQPEAPVDAATTAAPPSQSVAASSAAAAPASSSPTAVVSDNPTFDLTGSGSDCVMTYAPTRDGTGTLTVVTVDVPGEIITHVSDTAGNLHRNDQRITQGPNAFTYDVPLSQVGDMGAVFYLADGTSQSCTIEAAK